MQTLAPIKVEINQSRKTPPLSTDISLIRQKPFSNQEKAAAITIMERYYQENCSHLGRTYWKIVRNWLNSKNIFCINSKDLLPKEFVNYTLEVIILVMRMRQFYSVREIAKYFDCSHEFIRGLITNINAYSDCQECVLADSDKPSFLTKHEILKKLGLPFSHFAELSIKPINPDANTLKYDLYEAEKSYQKLCEKNTKVCRICEKEFLSFKVKKATCSRKCARKNKIMFDRSREYRLQFSNPNNQLLAWMRRVKNQQKTDILKDLDRKDLWVDIHHAKNIIGACSRTVYDLSAIGLVRTNHSRRCRGFYRPDLELIARIHPFSKLK